MVPAKSRYVGETFPLALQVKFPGCHCDRITLAPGIYEGFQEPGIKAIFVEFIFDHFIILVAAAGIELTKTDERKEIKGDVSKKHQLPETSPIFQMQQESLSKEINHQDAEQTHQMQEISRLEVTENPHQDHFTH